MHRCSRTEPWPWGPRSRSNASSGKSIIGGHRHHSTQHRCLPTHRTEHWPLLSCAVASRWAHFLPPQCRKPLHLVAASFSAPPSTAPLAPPPSPKPRRPPRELRPPLPSCLPSLASPPPGNGERRRSPSNSSSRRGAAVGRGAFHAHRATKLGMRSMPAGHRLRCTRETSPGLISFTLCTRPQGLASVRLAKKH